MYANDCKRVGLAFTIALTFIIFASGASAQTLNLVAPSLANVSGALTARFGVTVEALPILKGELQDGAELVLKCEAELHKGSEFWFDQGISAASFKSALKFDSLTRTFTMTLPDRSLPLRNSNFKQLLKEGWGTIEMHLGSWSMLERGQKYTLVLNTAMNEKDAPEGILRYIYFWSWDAGADNSFQLDFTY